MKEIKRFIQNGKEYVVFRALDGNIVIMLDPDAYQDIVSMPDPIIISFGVQIYNYTAGTLYFTVEGSGGGWSWGSVQQLGSIGAGLNAYLHAPSLATRTKPASATDDDVVLTFRAYSDAGYTVEVGSGYPVLVTYHWIDSDTMTLLDLDNFDAGSLESWTSSVWESFAIDTGYVLSSPNSAMAQHDLLNQELTPTGYIEKQFIVPSATVAYLIANVKFVGYVYSGQSATARVRVQEIRISKAGTIIVRSGSSPYIMTQIYTEQDKETNWLRMIAPIDVNETATYRLETVYNIRSTSSGRVSRLRAYYDNLKVVYS